MEYQNNFLFDFSIGCFMYLKGLGFCANYPIIEEQARKKAKNPFFTALSFGQREWSWAEQATQFNLRIL